MRQTYDLEYVEIIVVDNGSRELPEAIYAQFDNVHLIQELTPGPGPARNRGVSISKAPLLAFIDADCIAGEEWLSAIAAAFADPRTKIVGGDVRIAVANPDRMTMLEAYESIYAYRQKEYIERQGFSGTGNMAVRREIYDSVGPFAGIDVAEDREWGHRAGLRGYVIYYLPEMIVYHPARRSLSELRTKWRRHVAHDYAEHVHGLLDRTRWGAKAFVLALSPVVEIIKIARSDRVGTIHDRVLAFAALSQIRIYRSWRVLSAALVKNTRAGQMWNR
jgi:glycosyltransferase involved in cell wall biosynthesis